MNIGRGEAFEFEWRLTQKNALTGEIEPFDEETIVRAWLSLTFKGDPIVVDSELPLTRRQVGLRADGRLLWFGILAADDVTAALAAIATGASAYEVCEVEGERKSRELIVAD